MKTNTRTKVFIKPETIFWQYGLRELTTTESHPNHIVFDTNSGKERLFWEIDESTLDWSQKRQLAIALAQIEGDRPERILAEGLKIENCHVSTAPYDEEVVEQLQKTLKKLESQPDLNLKLSAIEAYTIAQILKSSLKNSFIYGESAQIAQKTINEIESVF